MPSLPYIGPKTTAPRGVQSRQSVEEQLDEGITRESVDGRVDVLASSRATKLYVDTQDAQYAEVHYYQSQDTLLVPNSSKGAVNGVASLDSSGKIPISQVPTLGVGYLKGPYGLTSTTPGTAGSTPLKVGSFHPGQTGVNFQPLVFMTVLATALQRARPVVEVRIGTASQTTYESQTLVASGRGVAMFDDIQVLDVEPAPGQDGSMQDGIQEYYSPNEDYTFDVWLYDSLGVGQVTIASSGIASSSAWLLRVVP